MGSFISTQNIPLMIYFRCLKHIISKKMLFYNEKPYNHIKTQKIILERCFMYILYFFQPFQILNGEKFMAAIFMSLFTNVEPTPR